MEGENIQSDEQKAAASDEKKAVVIEEDEHFKGEILTAEQNQTLKKISIFAIIEEKSWYTQQVLT